MFGSCFINSVTQFKSKLAASNCTESNNVKSCVVFFLLRMKTNTEATTCSGNTPWCNRLNVKHGKDTDTELHPPRFCAAVFKRSDWG